MTTFVVRLTDRKRFVAEVDSDTFEIRDNGCLVFYQPRHLQEKDTERIFAHLPPKVLAAFAPGQWAACYEKETSA